MDQESYPLTNGTFGGRELVVLHTTTSIFGNFLVQASAEVCKKNILHSRWFSNGYIF